MVPVKVTVAALQSDAPSLSSAMIAIHHNTKHHSNMHTSTGALVPGNSRDICAGGSPCAVVHFHPKLVGEWV